MPRSLRLFIRNVSHAWRGLLLAFKTERSFRLQIAFTLCVVVAMAIFPLQTMERVILLLAIAGVLVLELLNSTVERMVDLLKPRLDPLAGDAKDMMAGAVLIAAGFAGVIGILILWPYLTYFLERI